MSFLCDLYLYFIEKPNDLYLIKRLQYEDAREAAHKWFEAGENRDFMLVTESSKPYDEQASITEISLDWIDNQ